MKHYGIEMLGPLILPDQDKSGTTEGEIRYNTTTDIVEVKDSTGSFDGIKNDDRYYTEVEMDSGILDDRYYTETEIDNNYRTQTWISTNVYTKTELNNGSLDARYYTETELSAGVLDTRYYTETEISAGVLDTRYYTETEIDSRLTGPFGIGGPAGSSYPTLRKCTISSAGIITDYTGTDLMLNSAADASPDQEFIAGKLWGTVWNDVADFQILAEGENIEFGKVYMDTKEGMRKCFDRCQMGVAGIASNTFGIAVGAGENKIPIGISGWVLAYVDKEYDSGVSLVNDNNGILTKATLKEKRDFPERIIAVYKNKEKKEKFGSQGKEIDVNGRHWVRIL